MSYVTIALLRFDCHFVITVRVALHIFRYIAMITKQKAFNKCQIDADTQKIFMDETYARLMDPDN